MLRVLKILVFILAFLILSFVTQIGGKVFIITFIFSKFFLKKPKTRVKKISINVFIFSLFYVLFTILITPFVAKLFGREQLYLVERNHLKPLNSLTFWLNRNYVNPKMKKVLLSVSKEMDKNYSGSKINYLDANFPLINGFPLFPHLSHNDGKKIDISFFYKNKLTNENSEENPSFIGYGACEIPKKHEFDMPMECDIKGNFKYSLIQKVMRRNLKKNLIFDEERTKFFIELLIKNPDVSKIFIEPHLVERFHLKHHKIRFHGCHSVRHDDHIHFEVK